MKDIVRRIQKLETNLGGKGVPAEEKCQVIHGTRVIKKNGEEIEFIPDIPGDSEETRKKNLIERYGTDDGAIYIQLTDRYEYADEAEKRMNHDGS